MLNRFKSLAQGSTYALSQVKPALAVEVDGDGLTRLHHTLPSFTHVDQFHEYVATHSAPLVKRELHTASNRGSLPISRLNHNSPILAECLKFYQPAEGILPLDKTANHQPHPKQVHYDEYETLFNAANTLINVTRSLIRQSPHHPWMDPTSDAAAAIHKEERQIDYSLSLSLNSSDKNKYYAFRYAHLSEMQRAGTSKAFAYVALAALAKSNALGQIEGCVYKTGAENHYLLIINDIFYNSHAIVCDPWQGKAYLTTDIAKECRVPTSLDGSLHNIALAHFNPNYHKLRQVQHAPVHAGELAASVRNPLGLFSKASVALQGSADLKRREGMKNR